MVELKTVSVMITLLLAAATASANGSSGVGSARVSVTDEISGSSLGDKVQVEAGKLVEAGTGKPVLTVSKLARAKVDEMRENGKIFPSTLGRIRGFEFVPSLKGAHEQRNFWVICENEGRADCTQLLPAPGSPLTAPFIGTLRLKADVLP